MSCNNNNTTIYINFFDTKSGKIRVQQKSVVILKGEVRMYVLNKFIYKPKNPPRMEPKNVTFGKRFWLVCKTPISAELNFIECCVLRDKRRGETGTKTAKNLFPTTLI